MPEGPLPILPPLIERGPTGGPGGAHLPKFDQRGTAISGSVQRSMSAQLSHQRSRIRSVIASALSALLARGATIALSLVTVPLSLKYLDADGYGAWATITSVMGLVAFADLGIGNGLMNMVATALGRDDERAVRKALSNGLALLCTVAVIVLSLYFATLHVLPWSSWLGLGKAASGDDVLFALSIVVVVLALNLPTGIIQRVLFGLQRGYWNGAIQVGGAIAALLATLTAIHLDWRLPGMVAASLGGPLVATLVGGAVLLASRPTLLPRSSDVDGATVRALASTGVSFFVLQLGASLSYASDNVVIANVLGVTAVADFSVHQRLFGLVPVVIGMALTPLWPVYAEARARNDFAWIRKMLLLTSVAFPLAAMIAAALLVALAPELLRLWVGEAVRTDRALCLALAAWVCVDTAGRAIAMFLNGVSVLRAQIVISLTFLAICLPLKMWCASRWGVAGVPAAVAVSYVVVHVPAYWWLIRRWMVDARARTDTHGGT